ncbi:MAG: hypothetical protein LRZ84_16250 [Desertifilum sp.]|nr:hypothetical protein [Desertifilum sp.]
MTSKIQNTKQVSGISLDYLVSSGLDKRESQIKDLPLKVYLSDSQEKKVEEYCKVFGVSVRTMLNSCINYIIFLADKKGIEVKDLQYYPKRLGTNCHDLILNTETVTKLRNSGVNELEEAGKYAIAGIKVLYEKNLDVRSKTSK